MGHPGHGDDPNSFPACIPPSLSLCTMCMARTVAFPYAVLLKGASGTCEFMWNMRVPQEGTRVYPGLLPPGILWEVFSGTLRRNAGLRPELAIKLLTEPLQGCGEGMGREEMKRTKACVCTE